MNEYRYEAMIGVLVLAAMVSLAILIVATGDIEFFKDYFDCNIYFDRVSGILPGTPVRIAGVTIGKVKNIQLMPGEGRVKVVVSIDKNQPITKTSKVRITSSGIIGENYLDFSLAESKEFLPMDGTAEIMGESDVSIDEIKNAVGKFINTIGSDDLVDDVKTIIKKGRSTMEKTERFALFLNEMQDRYRPDIETSVDDLRTTAANLRSFSTTIDDSARQLLGDGNVPNDLRETADAAKKLMQRFNQTADKLDKIVDSGQKSLASIDEVIKNARYITTNVGDVVSKADSKLDTVFGNITQFSTDLKLVIEDLKESKSLAGKILHDKELANKMDTIIDGVKRFTDKVEAWSEDPASLLVEYFKAKDMYRDWKKQKKEGPKKPVKKGFGPAKKETVK